MQLTGHSHPSGKGFIQAFLASVTFLCLISVLAQKPKEATTLFQFLGGTTAALFLKHRSDAERSLYNQQQQNLSSYQQHNEQMRLQQARIQMDAYRNHLIADMLQQKAQMDADLDRQRLELRQREVTLDQSKTELVKQFNEMKARLQMKEMEYNELRSRLILEIEEEKRSLGDREMVMMKEYNEKLTELTRKERDLQQQLAQSQKVQNAQLATREQQLINQQYELGQERVKLLKEYESKAAELAQQVAINEKERITLKQQLEAEYQQKGQLLEAYRQKIVSGFQQDWANKVESYDNYIALLRQQLEQAQIDLEGALHPKRAPASKKYAGYLANQAIDAIREFDLPVYYEDVTEHFKGGYSIYLTQGRGVKPEEVFRCQATIATRIGVAEEDVVMEIDPDGLLVIDIAASQKHRSLDPKKAKMARDYAHLITEPSQDLLEDVLLGSIHYSIFGDSGQGKSTFVNNLLSLIKARMGQHVNVRINDLKFPDTDWKILGQHVKPDYIDIPTALEGVKDLAKFILGRLNQHKLEAMRDLPLSEFAPSIWVVDECQTLVSQYKARAAEPLKFGLRVGRSSKVRIIYVGQSAQVSAYGMNKPDMNNSTRFWLGGEFALTALRSELEAPTETKKRLREEIYARQAKIEAEIEEGHKNPPSQYFALVKRSGRPPFLMTLPPVNAYAALEVAEVPVPETGFVPDTNLDIPEEDLLEQIEREIKAAEAAEAAAGQPPEGDRLSDPAVASRLNLSLKRDDLDIINKKLSDVHRIVVQYAADHLGNWVKGSEIISNRNAIKKRGYKAADLADIFQQLAKDWGLGEAKEINRVWCYRYVNLERIVTVLSRQKGEAFLTIADVMELPLIQEVGFTSEAVLECFDTLVNVRGQGEMGPDDRSFRAKGGSNGAA